jgi:hypothetical protein
MNYSKLQWLDCDIADHADGMCFMAITEDGEILRDCEDS